MDASAGYDAILRALAAEPRIRIVESFFDEVNFGNFIVRFEADGQPRSIVNDRGELVLCSDLEGSRDCRTALQSLYGVDKPALLRALGL